MSAAMRICVIGAGPSGLSVLHHWGRLKHGGRQVPDIVCYEKQDKVGGLWNFTWMTGVDKNGEESHSSVYHHMRINGPKETMEYPDYTFDKHFGTATPSYLPYELVRDYLEGRLADNPINLKLHIKFNTVVKHVSYNEATDDFSVTIRDYKVDKETTSAFTHVIVASGAYHTPRLAYYAGLESFPGRILHAHDFKSGKQFSRQRVLIVGACRSAEDIASHLNKYGAAHVIISHRTKPIGVCFPPGVEERACVERVDGKTVHFIDGSTFETDAIILCTGYLSNFPFLEDGLRPNLQEIQPVYPNLYKLTLHIEGGNNKLFFLATMFVGYSFPIFDAQALWSLKYILGDIVKTEKADMVADLKAWKKLEADTIYPEKDVWAIVCLQSAFIQDLWKEVGIAYDTSKTDEIIKLHIHNREKHFPTYKDKVFKSVFTGTEGLAPLKHWVEDPDDEFEAFCDTLRKY